VKPARVQLQRTAGWRMPPNTVKCDRRTDWGNPYRISRHESGRWMVEGPGLTLPDYCGNREGAQLKAVARFKAYAPADSPLAEAARRLLVGKNLACWCKPDQACHVDWLLELANADS
jgi:hypothetical protein